jgi:hypothetical protein
MTAGLPGAGIGGLFYLASTFLMPVRSVFERLSGRAPSVPMRRQTHSVLIAVGILASLWLTGWLLAFVMPATRLASAHGSGLTVASRNAIPLATFGIGVGTLVVVLIAVELASRAQAARPASSARRLLGKGRSP